MITATLLYHPISPKRLIARREEQPARTTCPRGALFANDLPLGHTVRGHFNIYRSNKKNGKYEWLGAVRGNELSCIDTSAKKGKSYFYKVEACNYMDWSGETKSTMSKPMKIKTK